MNSEEYCFVPDNLPLAKTPNIYQLRQRMDQVVDVDIPNAVGPAVEDKVALLLPDAVADQIGDALGPAVNAEVTAQVPSVVASEVAATVPAAVDGAIEVNPTVSGLVDDVAAVDTRVGRVDPGTNGATAQQLRVTVNGPRWLPPDAVSPLLFDAAGDGVTDDYAAIMQAHDARGGKGKIDLGGRRYYSASTLNFTGGIILDGGGMGADSGIGRVGEIQFPMDIDGIVVTNTVANSSVFRDITISTPHSATTPTAGPGHGLTIKSQSARLDNVYVHGFRGNGIQVLGGTTPYVGINANLGMATHIKSYYNGGHGIYMFGADANAWAWLLPNTGANRGYGIYNDALYHNAFYSAHAIRNLAGDYYDDGWGSLRMNPYAEMDVGNDGGPFRVGPNSQAVQVYMGGPGSPEFAAAAINDANSKGWIIIRDGVPLTDVRHHTPSGYDYRWRMDAIANGTLELRNSTDGVSLIGVGRAGGAGSLGFHGVTPTARATVTGSRGGNAALASLLTALAAKGLITDGTTE